MRCAKRFHACAQMLSLNREDRSAFCMCFFSHGRAVAAHGTSRGVPSLHTCSVSIRSPLQVENRLPYSLQLGLGSQCSRVHELPPGGTLPLACFPIAPNVPLRFRIAGEWAAAVAEYVMGGRGRWKCSPPSQLRLLDLLGRPAWASLRAQLTSERSVLTLRLHAPLWVFDDSGLPLQYQIRSRFGRRRVRKSKGESQAVSANARRTSTHDRGVTVLRLT